MLSIKKHYKNIEKEVRANPQDIAANRALPSRTHVIVLVSKLNKPAIRAISYARSTEPSLIEIVSVAVRKEQYLSLEKDWVNLKMNIPLRVLASPYREITRPVINYVKSIRKKSPRDLVVVYVPEFVVAHWWQQFLHNQSAIRIKSALHFMTNVVIASVPYQLDSAKLDEQRIRKRIYRRNKTLSRNWINRR
jgi:hypothetical protein